MSLLRVFVLNKTEMVGLLDTQWQVFRAVVECKGFSRAAVRLHLSQSAVSQQIKALENYYGVSLLDRGGKRVRLNAAGRQLYPYVLKFSRLYREAQTSLRGVREQISGEIVVGASLTIGEYVLPKRLAVFQRRYPKVRFKLQVADTSEICDRLQKRKVMLAFVEDVVDRKIWKTAITCGGDELWVLAAHAIVPKMPVPFSFLFSFPWILPGVGSSERRAVRAFMEARGIDASALPITMELDSMEAVKSVAVQGGVVTILPSDVAKQDVQERRLTHIQLEEGSIKRKYSLLTGYERGCKEAVETFRRFLLTTTERDAC